MATRSKDPFVLTENRIQKQMENLSTEATHTVYASYIVPAVLLLLVVALIAYYVWPRDKTVLAMGPFMLYGAATVAPGKSYSPVLLMDQSQVATGFSNNFTFSMYVYVSDASKPVIGQQPPNTLVTLTGAGAIVIDAAHATAQIQLTPTPTLSGSSTLTTTPLTLSTATPTTTVLYTKNNTSMTYSIDGGVSSTPTSLVSMTSYVTAQLKLNDPANPDLPPIVIPNLVFATLQSLRVSISTTGVTAYLNGNSTPISAFTIPIVPTTTLTAVLLLTPPITPSPADTITLPNFSVARWNQLAFSIEGRTVDVYLNGALATSMLLENVPYASPTQITLNPQPGYDGQVGYVQAWPRRLTMAEIVANYKQTSDRKGKPAIPDSPFQWSDLLKGLENGFCSLGICPTASSTSPLQYIDYAY
jgi:hypothetical protein